MKKAYNVRKGSLQDRFLRSRAKIQIYGGGVGNGKTSCGVVKGLQLARAYPGMECLVARSTYPKLNDTIRKAFLKDWCPPAWIKKLPTKEDNDLILNNDSVFHFRYIQQQGRGKGESTSNLLSANYDLIIIDQPDDPEISEKDFLDLLGRLRGTTPYRGDDPTMPRSGPRWMLLLPNPTRNWLYRKLVRPLQMYNRTGIRTDDLLWDELTDAPMVDLIEGSTQDNAENLEPDFIATLKSAYRGAQYERFFAGKWEAYEGLVYPEYDDSIHVVAHEKMISYYESLLRRGVVPSFVEGYDHGMAVPACYLIGFQDHLGILHLVDGFYRAEMKPDEIIEEVLTLKARWGIPQRKPIWADPACFRRTPGSGGTVGITIAGILDPFINGRPRGIVLQRASNSIEAGYLKVSARLNPANVGLPNPYNVNADSSPRLFISSKLDFVSSEFADYYWEKDTAGDGVDKPRDKNDHAMNTIKYMLTAEPVPTRLVRPDDELPAYMQWHETDIYEDDWRKAVRYG